MPGGRPPKLTDEVQRVICENLSACVHKQIAAGVAGIDAATFRRWMRLGKDKPRSRYGQFRAAVMGAEKRAELRLAASIAASVVDRPQAALELLARRWPKRWARKDRLQAHLTGGIEVRDGRSALAKALGLQDESDREASSSRDPESD